MFSHIRNTARVLGKSSRRRFTTETPQTPIEKAKSFLTDNKQQLGGGLLLLLAFKMLTGGEPKVDEKFETIQVNNVGNGQAGDSITIQNPHMPGTDFTVKIPANAKKVFNVKLPKCPSHIKVIVPEGVIAGSNMNVLHPGRPTETFLVKVPEGKVSGSSFNVVLP